MGISDFRAFYKREYRDSKGWHTEECEASQFEKWTSFPQCAYESREVLGQTPRTYVGNDDNYYALYEPGKVYLNERYYTYEDLFSSAFLEGFRDVILGCYNSNQTGQVKKVYGLTSDTYIFTKNLEGKYIFPLLHVYCGPGSFKDPNTFAARAVTINMSFMICTYKPEEIEFDETDVESYTIKKKDTGQTLLRGTGYDYDVQCANNFSGGMLGFTTGADFNRITLEQLEVGINNFYKTLRTVKIHVMAPQSSSFDRAEDYGKYYLFQPEYTRPNYRNYSEQRWGGFFIDLRNVPRYNVTGFNRIVESVAWNFVTIKWGQGPDESDPFKEPDPNDKDPGHGPGQDPGDGGGDGDHDNNSDDITPPGPPSLSGAGAGLFTIYNPSLSQLQALAQKLWSPDALSAILQYFTNPMDSILGLSIVPVKPKGGTTANIYLGVYNTEVTANVVDSDYVIVDCGTIPIQRYWGSYLDYDPYTKISCYLPYIGEIDVNPDQVMQKNVGVKYYVNVVTGDIVAMLCADGNIIYTAAGNCVRQLPLSNNDYSAIINTAVSAVSTLATAGATSGVGNAAIAGAQKAGKSTDLLEAKQTASSVGSGGSLVHDVMNAKFHYQHAGAIGTGSGQLSYQTPYLTIERPNLDLANNYKAFVGYPCNKTMTLSSCHGFTQIEATRLSVPGATDAEIAEISSLLVGGVII